MKRYRHKAKTNIGCGVYRYRKADTPRCYVGMDPVPLLGVLIMYDAVAYLV